ncbi:MAG TPA: glycosyltransferase family 4 protein [bacterium]|nr:glycosyltransferase family 4 protein [bacterium]
MSKPLILYVHHNTEHIGGADYCLFKMVREVVRSGEFGCLVLLSSESAIAELYRRESIPVFLQPAVPLRKSITAFPGWIGGAVAEMQQIRALTRRYPIRLLHSNDLFDFTANWAARRLHLSSCQHIRTILDNRKPTTRLLSWCCRVAADRIFCVSDAVHRHLFGEAKRQIHTLYDWLDLAAVGHTQRPAQSLRQELGRDPQDVLIGCLGRQVAWKGQHLLLQAAPIIAAAIPEAFFLFIGESPSGPYQERLQAMLVSSPVRDRIRFLGQRRDITSLLSQLDLVVHTSITPDPLPGVVMEAMSCGLLVVGPDSGGVVEMIEDEKSGYLYRCGDAQALATRTIAAWKQQENALAIRQTARQRVAQKFAKSRLVDQLLQEYRNLLQYSQ